MTKEEYNSEPVYYCKNCLSLRILHEEICGYDYCDECGSANIASCSIEEWEQLYKNAHEGRSFLNSK